MKKVCYLSDVSKKDIFKNLENELELAVSHYDVLQVKSLVTFVNREKTMAGQDFFVIDITDADFSQEHIVYSMQLLKRFSSAVPIFIAPESEDTTILYGKLVSNKIKNLITLTEDADLTNELKLCISGEAKFSTTVVTLQSGLAETAKKAVKPLISIPEGLVLNIGVGGTMERIGTTTQVFALYHYLKSLKFKPLILDESQQLISMLMQLYGDEMTQDNGYITVKGISFAPAILPDSEFNVFITDFGIISDNNADRFLSSDARILIGGVKPWEIVRLAGCRKKYNMDADKRLITLVSFATSTAFEELREYLGSIASFVPYQPNIWEPGNFDSYAGTLLPQLKEICNA